MSKESLIEALSAEERRDKLAKILHALNFSKLSGLVDEKGNKEKTNMLDVTFYHGYSLRQIANALNLCQRPKG